MLHLKEPQSPLTAHRPALLWLGLPWPTTYVQTGLSCFLLATGPSLFSSPLFFPLSIKLHPALQTFEVLAYFVLLASNSSGTSQPKAALAVSVGCG